MAILKLKLEGQLLTVTNQEVIASGDANIDRCVFEFDKEWDDFVKTAVFYQDKSATSYVVLDADNSCYVPAEAMMSEGNMSVGVFGLNGPKQITSTIEKVYIHKGAIENKNISREPTDDVFLAIIAQYQRLAGMMDDYIKQAKEFSRLFEQQNEILESLNAFDVVNIMKRLAEINNLILEFQARTGAIEDREFVIWEARIEFNAEGQCVIEDERVKESNIVDVYFTAECLERASTAVILAESYDGGVRLQCTKGIEGTLVANIVVRRY